MKHLLLILFVLFGVSLTAQKAGTAAKKTEGTKAVVLKPKKTKKPNAWKTLAKITYIKEYDEVMGFKVDKPVFSQDILDLEGKDIEIKGYIIPVEGYKSHKEFIFSAFPYNMCFFCGGAGPETVMEVEAMDPVKFTAESIRLRGKLKLNADDINKLMFSLQDAQLID